MILSHQCIRYAHISASPSGKPLRTLVIGTNLSMPEPGKPCTDERLLDLLEYLEIIKNDHAGEFDSIEIRGSREAKDNLGLPHFLSPGERCFNGVCV